MATDRGSVRWHRGGWEIRVQADGRRVTRRVKAPNNRAGRRVADEACEQLATELGLGAESMTVAQLLEWYELLRSPRWSPSTAAAHEHHVRPIIAALGAVEVSKLSAMEIEAVYATWHTGGVKVSTVRRRHAILAAALAQAERKGVILLSPARSVELESVERRDHGGLPDPQTALAAVAKLKHARLKVAARLALAPGARRGEIVALRWCDLDLEDETVRVAGSIAIDPAGRMVRKSTKTGDNRLPMAIDKGTVEILKAWRKTVATDAMALGVGRPGPNHPVLPSPTDPGEPWSPDRITTAWGRLRDDIGMGKVRWHDLRHLHATALVEAGISPSTGAGRLGHASTKMFLDVYTHATPASDRAAADVIGRLAGDS